MGAKPRSVGRPRKRTVRVELRLNSDDRAVQALVKEAAERGVSLQQHITDILIARFLGVPIQQQAPEQQTDHDSARALADEFL